MNAIVLKSESIERNKRTMQLPAIHQPIYWWWIYFLTVCNSRNWLANTSLIPPLVNVCNHIGIVLLGLLPVGMAIPEEVFSVKLKPLKLYYSFTRWFFIINEILSISCLGCKTVKMCVGGATNSFGTKLFGVTSRYLEIICSSKEDFQD